MKRNMSCRFDFDDSLTTTKAIKKYCVCDCVFYQLSNRCIFFIFISFIAIKYIFMLLYSLFIINSWQINYLTADIELSLGRHVFIRNGPIF